MGQRTGESQGRGSASGMAGRGQRTGGGRERRGAAHWGWQGGGTPGVVGTGRRTEGGREGRGAARPYLCA